MRLHQFFDPESSSFTYLLARRRDGEAILIDPVLPRVADYLQIIEKWGCRLVRAFDTHFHADHVSGVGAVRDATRCAALIGEESPAEGACDTYSDGEVMDVDGVRLEAIHTPGHTADSYCFRAESALFTGDTLLIGGTGRTDLPTGDAAAQYDSLHRRILALPGRLTVFPGHDYRGRTRSTLNEERQTNPRLLVESREAYVEMMAKLDLPPPTQMPVAAVANRRLGLSSTGQQQAGIAVRIEAKAAGDCMRIGGLHHVQPHQS
jgi:glyoxylase-like metal-dependent hydrolase (beta-lactamase superfamily II)